MSKCTPTCCKALFESSCCWEIISSFSDAKSCEMRKFLSDQRETASTVTGTLSTSCHWPITQQPCNTTVSIQRGFHDLKSLWNQHFLQPALLVTRSNENKNIQFCHLTEESLTMNACSVISKINLDAKDGQDWVYKKLIPIFTYIGNHLQVGQCTRYTCEKVAKENTWGWEDPQLFSLGCTRSK